ncbi:glycoside hydrolase family 26 protein [Actinocorallia longicatena]|uniref:GH26 domain-containing protein n=1 Tax=Actinocorallia longicatena TaxID=111803 RepID=A0ABP6QNX4_9ACTN
MKRRALFAVSMLISVATGVSVSAPVQATVPGKKASAAAKPRYNNKAPARFKRPDAPGAFKVKKYIYPRKEYYGVFTGGLDKVAGAKRFAKTTARKPNMIKGFYNWGDPFDTAWAGSVWKYGAIPQLELELWPGGRDLSLATVAAGLEDDYIVSLARSIRAAKMPVVFSFGHEFNGDWYPWGQCTRPENDSPDKENACDHANTPADWVAAWHHMHDVFQAAGATNAIWLWQPNEIGGRPEIDIREFWPGASYVDWAGVVAYARNSYKRRTFAKLFVPTITKIRTFTKKPIIIPEVSATPNRKYRNAFITDFLAAVNRYPDIIGFIWFNTDKRPAETDGDFRLESQKNSVPVFRKALKKGYFTFPVK